MQNITLIGIDLGKHSFHIHCQDKSGKGKRLARTVLIFTESSEQLSRATDRVPGLPASPGYAQ
ncbi:hypothetical protein HP449_004148 [Escherichia coli]|nr:hypothetical protein [Escherichia coli]EFP1538053.1 hypothetical protein [Escherichia coli]EFS2881415.1 hypothetical protein [Escherichia coli]EGG0485584.1 hypothetical protein [Escherichia coli]EGR8407832.1 hypothetical protein [Escherichia coli]